MYQSLEAALSLELSEKEAASNAIAKSRQINWRIKRAKTCTCSSIYFLER